MSAQKPSNLLNVTPNYGIAIESWLFGFRPCSGQGQFTPALPYLHATYIDINFFLSSCWVRALSREALASDFLICWLDGWSCPFRPFRDSGMDGD